MKLSTPEYTYICLQSSSDHMYEHQRKGESKFVYEHCGGRYVILTFCDCDTVEKLIILQLETFDISNVIC